MLASSFVAMGTPHNELFAWRDSDQAPTRPWRGQRRHPGRRAAPIGLPKAVTHSGGRIRQQRSGFRHRL